MTGLDEMRHEYDIRGGERGKYFNLYNDDSEMCPECRAIVEELTAEMPCPWCGYAPPTA